ncbi:MAG: Fic family protein [Candidatus Micrarchaeota archaeon]|nr:Fic family protein [Candidatus Micrarchaeota archaeon]
MVFKEYRANVKGVGYWYVNGTAYINKGAKPFSTTGSLGRVDATTLENRQIRFAEFKKRFFQQEAAKRTEYWVPKTQNRKAYPAEQVAKMERLRTELYWAKRELGLTGDAALEQAFLIDFVYNSNRIEGSRLPRSEVLRLVQQRHPQRGNEVFNTQLAKNYLEEKFNFSTKRLIEAHKTLLEHEPAKHGLRTTDIVVGNQPISATDIKNQLDSLFSWYKTSLYRLYPPELAFAFYQKFEQIHPFMDGNGRMGRLLMNLILKKNKYHPIIIWNSNRLAHFNAFEKIFRKGNADFLRFMNGQYEKTYETYLRKVRGAADLEQRIKDLLSPSEA